MIDTKAVLNRYTELGLRDRFHLLIRIKTCPWGKILQYFPRADTLIDLGCGHGLLINLLAAGDYGYNKLTGLDLDVNKINIAKQIENNHISFYAIANLNFKEKAAVITIFDLLYLLPFHAQRELINHAYSLLFPGGYLVVKEVDKKPLWKFLINFFQESISVKLLRITLGSKFYFSSESALKKILEETGFKVSVKYLHKGYLHPHILYLCQKLF